MSIFKKLADARTEFHSRMLTKSGHNKFAGYRYFELADFVIAGMDCMRLAGLVPVISFTAEQATMTIHEIDGDGTIVIASPMSSAALKGCHEVQNLGAVQTYLRRYLWVAALEIVEHDPIDASEPVAEPAEPDTALLEEANAAAQEGMPALEGFWRILSPAEKKVMKPLMPNLKAIASGVAA